LRVVIEQNTFGDEEKTLIEELGALKIPYSFGMPDSVTGGEYIFVRGSTGFVRKFNSLFGDYCECESFNLSNFEYTNYAPNYGIRMLNDDYVILTWDLLKLSKEYIYQRYYDYYEDNKTNPKFFVRPNSGEKIFSGTYIDYKNWEKHFKAIETLPGNTIKPDTKVIISPYKEILAEYRILMYEDTLLGYSIYSGEANHADKVAIDFFSKTATYKPDNFYSLDVCKTDMGWKIVEMNHGLSSGWYDCNYGEVLKFFKHNNRH
jgi:hypothetical protein